MLKTADMHIRVNAASLAIARLHDLNLSEFFREALDTWANNTERTTSDEEVEKKTAALKERLAAREGLDNDIRQLAVELSIIKAQREKEAAKNAKEEAERNAALESQVLGFRESGGMRHEVAGVYDEQPKKRRSHK